MQQRPWADGVRTARSVGLGALGGQVRELHPGSEEWLEGSSRGVTGWGLAFDKMPLAAALSRGELGTVRSFQQASHGLGPARLLCSWNSHGKNSGVGCHSLLQEIFPTQGLNPGLPHCGQILYHQSHEGSPRTLEWVAYPFSKGFPNPGIEPGSPALQADSLPAELLGKWWKTAALCRLKFSMEILCFVF